MITVGVTELHGITKEICNYPPDGVSYIKVNAKKHSLNKVISSSAKGAFNFFDGVGVDLLEAPIFPILTNSKWIYTPADFQTCANFKLIGLGFPRIVRVELLRRLFSRENFKKLIFKSYAGLETLQSYGRLHDEELLKKTMVVYPAVRNVDDRFIRFNTDRINILFVGDFLSKGGVHVIDVFEELQKKYDNLWLRLCCSESFKSNNQILKKVYLDKIKHNERISIGWVERNELLDILLPDSDIFICPTYRESFGYSIEEAMAYAVPVIATDYFAIPEIVDHGKNGFLISLKGFSCIEKYKNYIVDFIPEYFRDYMNKNIYKHLEVLIESAELRKNMGMTGLSIAREKFSFKKRNEIMKKVYEDSL